MDPNPTRFPRGTQRGKNEPKNKFDNLWNYINILTFPRSDRVRCSARFDWAKTQNPSHSFRLACGSLDWSIWRWVIAGGEHTLRLWPRTCHKVWIFSALSATIWAIFGPTQMKLPILSVLFFSKIWSPRTVEGDSEYKFKTQARHPYVLSLATTTTTTTHHRAHK